jgi:hypothetical protein
MGCLLTETGDRLVDELGNFLTDAAPSNLVADTGSFSLSGIAASLLAAVGQFVVHLRYRKS